MSHRNNWPWTILGVSHDGADKRAVKKAYAKALKQIDPAENQKGFEELRNAYEHALRLLESSNKPKGFADTAESTFVPRMESTAPEKAPHFGEGIEQPVFLQVDIASLSEKANALIIDQDFDENKWREVFDCLLEVDFVTEKKFEKVLLQGIFTNFIEGRFPTYKMMPGTFINLLEARFNWMSQGLDFQKTHPEHFKTWKWLKGRYDFEHKPQSVYYTAAPDPQLPVYARWWFIIMAYAALVFVVSGL